MIIDSICENMVDKIKKECIKCNNLGIASQFEGNINYYTFCCNALRKKIDDTITRCPFSERDTDNLKHSLEMMCAMHDIPVPDFIKEL